MNIEKLNKWADLLLDTGKRNNLINFKDSKMGTAEVVFPEFSELFSKAEHLATFEVYDPKLDDDDEPLFTDVEPEKKEFISKEEYISTYAPRLKKHGQILVYNPNLNPVRAVKNIGKRAKTAIEETGVNIAYLAFGFINWTEGSNASHVLRAPVLLAPISIENESAIDPYYIKVTDSDVIVNPTFTFKLKNEYGIELPAYEEEGVEEYLTKVEELLSKLKWTVTRECKIGTFSFLKINMHKDLKGNAQKILNNDSIRALIGERVSKPERVDDGGELCCVVDADSSQAEAIRLARSGQSFVLQGPPGTGKSQTITNVIAECLSEGKKVLFVSEKLAALSVVYDKLKKAGLEEFCLELHSHKANKRDFINELCHTLKLQRSVVSERAQREIDAKNRAKLSLDNYADELHKVRPVVNKTLYRMYEEISACREVAPVDFVINNLNNKGEAHIESAEEKLSRYAEYVSSIGSDYHQNVWYGYVDTDCSYQAVAKLKSDLQNAVTFLQEIIKINTELLDKYAISALNLTQARALFDFFKLVKDSEFITPQLLKSAFFESALKTLEKMSPLAKEINLKENRLSANFDEDLYKLNGKELYKVLYKKYQGVFSRLFSKEYRKIASDLRLCKKDGKRVNYRLALSTLSTLSEYEQKCQEYKKLEEKVIGDLSENYSGVKTDFEKLFSELNALQEIKKTKLDFALLPTFSKEKFVKEQGVFEALYNRYNDCFSAYGEVNARVEKRFDKTEYDAQSKKLEKLLFKYESCLNTIDNLDNWCEFVKLLGELSALELRAFVDYTILHRIPSRDVVLCYKKAFYSQWVDSVIHDTPLLINLSRIPHDEAVKIFKAKDELGFEINKAKIKAKLSAERPSLDMIAQGSAVSLLLREGEKKRKQKGIRLLLEEAGELIQTLKPCFLMSRLSVSTYLSSDICFDVVVFDEASQIFPQDAIGAIYRGKQLIVVGDSKQMPPSNFFNSTFESDEDSEEFDDFADFESILDICSTSFAQKRLKWHYRSRYEQLISFSNKNFYDNDLVTFPSSKKDAKGIGVDYYHVDGTFDRKTKTNRAEAEKIVDLVFNNIEKYPERSLGVVAFSISQQNLIDKLISKRRRLDPSKEEFFKSDKIEPFFVKNLETVQGDERDTIIFSIAYAKDEQGKLLLNFGPVNREGGERRLNVAITRAKHNVIVVSSMHGYDIDLSRTKSVGARLLSEYLDYAENGEITLEREESGNAFENRSNDFINEVKDFLTSNGYTVDIEVGCSSFKIDLAVKHPRLQDYVLAIECDGATYRASKNTRDRDRLRQEVLERMGWKYYRIWSTDWFRNKKVEQERLLSVVKLAVDYFSKKAPTKKAETPAVSFEERAEVKHFEFPKYKYLDVLDVAGRVGYSIASTALNVIKAEAPVSEEWLLRRMVFMFGREKVTSVVKEQFTKTIQSLSKYGVVCKNGYLCMDGAPMPMLRVPDKNAREIRDVKYIPLEELALGMEEILKQNVTVEKGGLFRLLVSQLGFARIGDAILDRLEDALDFISHKVNFDGDMLSLK